MKNDYEGVFYILAGSLEEVGYVTKIFSSNKWLLYFSLNTQLQNASFLLV